MIARKVPGEGRMYQFDGEISEIKEAIRAKTNDSMADEAKWVFESAAKLFNISTMKGKDYKKLAKTKGFKAVELGVKASVKITNKIKKDVS